MRPMLELNLADGPELDIPLGAVVMFEEMTAETNPNFPGARAYVHYAMGQNLRQAIVSQKVSDLIFELGINTQAPGRWLRLTNKETGLALVLLVQNVVGRRGLEDGCELSYMLGDEVVTVEVTQSRREIKKWSEAGETGRPEGLIQLPVPEENQ